MISGNIQSGHFYSNARCNIPSHLGPRISIISMAQVGPLNIVYFIERVPCEFGIEMI